MFLLESDLTIQYSHILQTDLRKLDSQTGGQTKQHIDNSSNTDIIILTRMICMINIFYWQDKYISSKQVVVKSPDTLQTLLI